MADVKISALTAASALTGTELIECVQSGTNKKTTTQDIADLAASSAAYSSYAANLSQFSTTAPAEDTLFSSLPLGAIVWARSSAGVYTATLSGQFLTGKVPYQSAVVYDGTTASSIRGYYLIRTSDNVVTLTTTIDGTPTDGVLQGTFIEIRVYP